MKKMTKEGKSKRWLIIAILMAVFLLYFGLYLHLRMNHTFIHRAGKYANNISRGRPRRSSNHFIEPADAADGPQVFASVMFAAAATAGTNDLDDAEVEKMLAVAGQAVEEEQNRIERLFLLFEPAAFLETLVWKTIDPNPLTRRYKDAKQER